MRKRLPAAVIAGKYPVRVSVCRMIGVEVCALNCYTAARIGALVCDSLQR
jgi:hypothetical protein